MGKTSWSIISWSRRIVLQWGESHNNVCSESPDESFSEVYNSGCSPFLEMDYIDVTTEESKSGFDIFRVEANHDLSIHDHDRIRPDNGVIYHTCVSQTLSDWYSQHTERHGSLDYECHNTYLENWWTSQPIHKWKQTRRIKLNPLRRCWIRKHWYPFVETEFHLTEVLVSLCCV